jgi:hypothetical protein
MVRRGLPDVQVLRIGSFRHRALVVAMLDGDRVAGEQERDLVVARVRAEQAVAGRGERGRQLDAAAPDHDALLERRAGRVGVVDGLGDEQHELARVGSRRQLGDGHTGQGLECLEERIAQRVRAGSEVNGLVDRTCGQGERGERDELAHDLKDPRAAFT